MYYYNIILIWFST